MIEHEKAKRRIVGRFAGNHMTTLHSALFTSLAGEHVNTKYRHMIGYRLFSLQKLIYAKIYGATRVVGTRAGVRGGAEISTTRIFLPHSICGIPDRGRRLYSLLMSPTDHMSLRG